MNRLLSKISDGELEAEYLRRFTIKVGEKLINTPQIARHLKAFISKRKREHFVVLFLNSRDRLISSEILFSGTISETAIYPREVLRKALELGASSCIIGHNHPSGYIIPTGYDLTITDDIKKVLNLVDISLRDHIIVAYGEKLYYSFANNNLL